MPTFQFPRLLESYGLHLMNLLLKFNVSKCSKDNWSKFCELATKLFFSKIPQNLHKASDSD